MADQRRELVAICAIVLCALQWSYAARAGGIEAELPTLAHLVKRVSPAIVSVTTTRQVDDSPRLVDPRDGFPDLPQGIGTVGSGVVLDSTYGLIVTANHVIGHADAIKVTLAGGLVVDARVVVVSRRDDLAILRVITPGLTEVAASQATGVEVGDFVLAVGNPLESAQTTTFGIVSALHATVPGIENADFVATDALVERGSSGGALINVQGELVGVIVARAGARGFGFAAPITAVRRLLDRARLRLS